MADDERRHDVTHRRREADERGRAYTAGANHRDRAEWGTGRSSASAHGRGDGLRPSGADRSRSPQKRRHGAGDDLPKPVHFVSAAVSAAHGDSRNPASWSDDPVRQAMSSLPPEPGTLASDAVVAPPAPAPGSLASNTVVAQMMKRMNYKEGTGLGRLGQGIVAPIEAVLRPHNAGLGTVERPWDRPPPSAKNWPQWDDAGGGGARKRKHEAAGGARNPKHDRRESEHKILAKRLEEGAAEAVARVQTALARAARWSSTSSGQPGDLSHSGDATAAITKAMKRVQEEIASGTLTTGEVAREFTALKEKCPREYTAYGLADTARAVAAPLLLAAFQRWEPLEDPSRGLEAVSALRGVLLDDGSAASPYAALADDMVVRPALASAWCARDPEPMIRFLDTWGDALPVPAIQRLLERVVMPKLSAAVESWEPRWEPDEPCHVWLLPWAPLLGAGLLEPLYAAVRRKLGEALLGWRAAAGASADYHMVAPWKDAFGAAAWEEFVGRHVVPYLRHGLRARRVATPPEEGDGGGGVGRVVRWAPSVVSARDMARLLDEEFFGKWQHALCRWLWAARPALREAVAWHEGWKRLFAPELLAEERVSAAIEVGLRKISRAAQGLEVYRPERGEHAGGEAQSCRSRSRRRVLVGSGSNKRH